MQHDTKEYYKALAEVRELNINTLLKPSVELLSVTGILMSMIGELTLYGTKNGKTDKYNESLDRLTQIGDFIDGCNKVVDHNYRLKMMLRDSIFKRDLLEQENETMKKQLEAVEQAYNAE